MDGLLSSCVKLAIIVCKLDLYQKKNRYVVFHTTIILVIPLYIGFTSLDYSPLIASPVCSPDRGGDGATAGGWLRVAAPVCPRQVPYECQEGPPGMDRKRHYKVSIVVLWQQ